MFNEKRDELIKQLLIYYMKALKPWGELYGKTCCEGEIFLNSIGKGKIQCCLMFIFSDEDDSIEIKIENGEITNITSFIKSYTSDDVKEKIELTRKYLEDHIEEIESSIKTPLLNKILKYNLN